MQTDVVSRPRDGANLPDQWDSDPVDLIETPVAVPTWASGHRYRTAKAGHMTASDCAVHTAQALAGRGPSTHDPGIHDFLGE